MTLHPKAEIKKLENELDNLKEEVSNDESDTESLSFREASNTKN